MLTRLLITFPLLLEAQTISDTRFTDTSSQNGTFREASAAVGLDEDFIFVASNEDETIRLYNINTGLNPVYRINLRSLLGPTTGASIDIESAGRVGDKIYWLGSHSNKKNGDLRPNANRIFATKILDASRGALATLEFQGRYDHLRADLVNWDRTNGHSKGNDFYGFFAATANGKGSELEDGFNIEGFTILPDGVGLLGFRNPLVRSSDGKKALIVPILNLASLVSTTTGGTLGQARFGKPVEIYLGARGIRSLGACKNSNDVVIVSGPSGDLGTSDPRNFRLFKWNRQLDLSARELSYLFEPTLRPEGFIEESCVGSVTETSMLKAVFDNGGGSAAFLGRKFYPGREVNILTNPSVSNGNISFNFTGRSGQNYRLAAADGGARMSESTPSIQDVSIPAGDGTGTIEIRDNYAVANGAYNPSRIYRVVNSNYPTTRSGNLIGVSDVELNSNGRIIAQNYHIPDANQIMNIFSNREPRNAPFAVYLSYYWLGFNGFQWRDSSAVTRLPTGTALLVYAPGRVRFTFTGEVLTDPITITAPQSSSTPTASPFPFVGSKTPYEGSLAEVGVNIAPGNSVLKDDNASGYSYQNYYSRSGNGTWTPNEPRLLPGQGIQLRPTPIPSPYPKIYTY